jgi:hypothetical protein
MVESITKNMGNELRAIPQPWNSVSKRGEINGNGTLLFKEIL